jgi:ANTAR domain
MDVIRVEAPSLPDAHRLIASLDGDFSATLHGNGFTHVVGITLDAEAAAKLVELFDTLGNWLAAGKLVACQIGFGARAYTLAAPSEGHRNDPTAFLLERTIQLQRALDSRIVLEQAKGVLVERHGITPDDAFKRLRREARSSRMNIHVLAAGIVATAQRAPGRSE